MSLGSIVLKTVTMLPKLFCFLAIVSHTFSVQAASVLILARGGSKGIPLKNIQKVGGITLLGRTILTAKRAGFFDITVSTDHPLIALEALKYKTSILKRSYATSSDWAPSIWGVLEFIQNRPDVNILILLQSTSPFVKAEHIYSSFNKLNHPKPFDCIFSVTRSHRLRWSHNNVGTIPLNFKYNSRPRRQDWSGEFIETGAFYISRKELIIQGYLQNNNCTVWEVSPQESLEIDTIYDLHLADILVSNKLI